MIIINLVGLSISTCKAFGHGEHNSYDLGRIKKRVSRKSRYHQDIDVFRGRPVFSDF